MLDRPGSAQAVDFGGCRDGFAECYTALSTYCIDLVC